VTSSDNFDPVPPRDEDLMRYLDGELEEAQSAEIEQLLQQDEQAAGKLAALSLLGELLRESADRQVGADGIADAVMAAVEAEACESDGGSCEDEVGLAPVVPLPLRPRDKLPVSPANDNSRNIFTLAAVAAAIAAGFFLWGRADTGSELAVTSTNPPVATQPAQPALSLAALEPSQAAAPAVPQPEPEEAGPGVEVASVDFGSLTGSVFYVSGKSGDDDRDATTTAVLWVTDDAGEDQ